MANPQTARKKARRQRRAIRGKSVQVTTFTFTPIGVVKSPFGDRASAPRQANVDGARDVRGAIELFAGHDFEDALSDLEHWDYIWVIFVFHRNVEEGRGFKPKVLPPRSEKKRGLFATRSPHRPNPIGMSVVALESISGLTLHVRGLDILDGTPVLDIKPYVAYADSYPDAKSGWVASSDPDPGFDVVWSEDALAQIAWLRDTCAIDLKERITAALSLGPKPHAYRRIRVVNGESQLAVKEWRAVFHVDGRSMVVDKLRTGYRAKHLATDPTLQSHRDFIARFGNAP